jgi:hypothetical protein
MLKYLEGASSILHRFRKVQFYVVMDGLVEKWVAKSKLVARPLYTVIQQLLVAIVRQKCQQKNPLTYFAYKVPRIIKVRMPTLNPP